MVKGRLFCEREPAQTHFQAIVGTAPPNILSAKPSLRLSTKNKEDHHHDRKVQIKAPFRADLVGSLLRPERLKAAHQQLAIGEIKQDQELNIQHAAIERIVKRQVELGFKAVTDGEFSRRYWHLDFLWGFERF